MNLYPIFYKGTPILIYATSLSDAKIPFDRISKTNNPLTYFKKLLQEAKDTPIETFKYLLSGDSLSYRDILNAQKTFHFIPRYSTEDLIPIPQELENAFEEAPKEYAKELPTEPKTEIPLSDDLFRMFDEINSTSKEINIPDLFG